MPRINYFPWRAEERKLRQRNFLLSIVGATRRGGHRRAAGELFYSQVIDNQKDRNQLLKTEIEKLDLRNARSWISRRKKPACARAWTSREVAAQPAEVVHLFDQLARTVPDGLYLTSIKQNRQASRDQGRCQSSTRVSAFMRNIDASEWARQPRARGR